MRCFKRYFYWRCETQQGNGEKEDVTKAVLVATGEKDVMVHKTEISVAFIPVQESKEEALFMSRKYMRELEDLEAGVNYNKIHHTKINWRWRRDLKTSSGSSSPFDCDWVVRHPLMVFAIGQTTTSIVSKSFYHHCDDYSFWQRASMPSGNNIIITSTVFVGQTLAFIQCDDFISFTDQLVASLSESLWVCFNSFLILCGH